MMVSSEVGVSVPVRERADQKLQHWLGKAASEAYGHDARGPQYSDSLTRHKLPDNDIDDTRKPCAEAERLGEHGSLCATESEHAKGKAMCLVPFLSPPGPLSPESVLPSPGLAIPRPAAARKKPNKQPRVEPMKIDARHVIGRKAEVKNRAMPIKKLPILHEPAGKFDPLRPVYQTVPDILFRDPPSLMLSF